MLTLLWSYKIILKKKKKSLEHRETTKYARIVGTGKEVEANCKEMSMEGKVEKTGWNQLLKSLECHAKNFGLYPSGDEKLPSHF